MKPKEDIRMKVSLKDHSMFAAEGKRSQNTWIDLGTPESLIDPPRIQDQDAAIM